MPIQGVGSDQYFFNPPGSGIVNSTTNGFQGVPIVTQLSDGRFVFAWNSGPPDTDGGTTGTSLVRARVYNADGTPQGNDFIVETTNAEDQFSPAVAALNDGHFVVTWTSTDTGDGDDFCVRARIFDADDPSAAAADFIVNTTTASFQRNSSVTTLANGNFLITYESLEGPIGQEFSIRARLFDSSGTAIGNDFLVNQIVVGIKETPKISALGDGFIVTWLNAGEDLTSPVRFRARIYDAAGNPGDDFVVNSTPSNLQGISPSVAQLEGGLFVVTWESTDFDSNNPSDTNSDDGSGTCIRARIFTSGGAALGNDFIVNTTTSNSQGSPTVTALADGRFVIAWDSFDTGDGSQTCVRARIFNVDGTPNGEDFIIPFVTVGDQFHPSLVALPDGRFAATWDSGTDIRAQFFDPKIFTGTDNADTWTGGNLIDQITGGLAGDTLGGLGGNDIISGEAGGDVLTGGLGKDLLAGGGDGDIFDFNLKGESLKGALRDVIADFVHLTDDMDVSGIDAKSGAGNQAFKWIGKKAFHDVKGELHYKLMNKAGTANDKTIVEGDINGNGRPDFQIELTGIINLTKGDFVL
jgi:hypothetical protein